MKYILIIEEDKDWTMRIFQPLIPEVDYDILVYDKQKGYLHVLLANLENKTIPIPDLVITESVEDMVKMRQVIRNNYTKFGVAISNINTFSTNKIFDYGAHFLLDKSENKEEISELIEQFLKA